MPKNDDDAPCTLQQAHGLWNWDTLALLVALAGASSHVSTMHRQLSLKHCLRAAKPAREPATTP